LSVSITSITNLCFVIYDTFKCFEHTCMFLYRCNRRLSCRILFLSLLILHQDFIVIDLIILLPWSAFISRKSCTLPLNYIKLSFVNFSTFCYQHLVNNFLDICFKKVKKNKTFRQEFKTNWKRAQSVCYHYFIYF